MRTDATRAGVATTLTVAMSDFPSDVAAISARPALTPVTTPLLETVATAALELAHTTRRPRSSAPDASVTRASSEPVPPAATSRTDGVTTTPPTGIGSSVSVTPHALPNKTAWTSGIPRQNQRMTQLLRYDGSRESEKRSRAGKREAGGGRSRETGNGKRETGNGKRE